MRLILEVPIILYYIDTMKEIPDFSQFYGTGYVDAFYGKGLIPYCMRHSHKLLESKFGKDVVFDKVIEIGSGTGSHLNFVKHQYSSYTLTDVNESVIQKLHEMSFSEKVQIQKIDSDTLPFPDNEFDRLVASHVLEHIHHPEMVLKEWSRVVKAGGVISIALPCDPGVAWRFGRYAYSRRAVGLKNGVSEYDLFVALEHVNAINGLMAMIQYFFDKRAETFWPFRIKLIDLNLFYIVHIINEK
jgi:SAM-dependent methyltransferase